MKLEKVYDNDELNYQIKLSQGKGYLTREAENILIKLADKTMIVKKNNYQNEKDREDAYMCAIYYMLRSWKSCDLRYNRNASNYFIEVFKRGLFIYINKESGYKHQKLYISYDTIFNNFDE